MDLDFPGSDETGGGKLAVYSTLSMVFLVTVVVSGGYASGQGSLMPTGWQMFILLYPFAAVPYVSLLASRQGLEKAAGVMLSISTVSVFTGLLLAGYGLSLESLLYMSLIDVVLFLVVMVPAVLVRLWQRTSGN